MSRFGRWLTTASPNRCPATFAGVARCSLRTGHDGRHDDKDAEVRWGRRSL